MYAHHNEKEGAKWTNSFAGLLIGCWAGSSRGWPGRWEAAGIPEIIWTILGAAVGGSGLVGLLFFFVRRYIERRLKVVEADEEKRKVLRMKRMQIDDELHHAYGRMFFWLHRAVITGQHNGELENAFHRLEAAEAKKKDLDREIIAESEQD